LDKVKKLDGIISNCLEKDCGFVCCDFGEKGHIIILPNELDGINADMMKHLTTVSENGDGSRFVKCTATDRVSCDNGYKPIQCRTFPLWLRGDSTFEKSTRCPLTPEESTLHAEMARRLFDSVGATQDFLDKAVITMYEKLYTVREATNDDLGVIMSIYSMIDADPNTFIKNDVVTVKNLLKNSIICESGGKVVGFMLKNSLYIDTIVSISDGAGTAMMKTLKGKYLVHISDSNRSSLNLFKKFGFRKVGDDKLHGYDRGLYEAEL